MPAKSDGANEHADDSSDEDSNSESSCSSEAQEELAEPLKSAHKAHDPWKFAAKRASIGVTAVSHRLQAQDTQKGRRPSLPAEPRRLSAPGAVQRRGSAGLSVQAEDIFKNTDSRGTRTHGEAFLEAFPEAVTSSKPGLEWVAKVQALEDVRERLKLFNEQVMFRLEASGLDIPGLGAHEKIKLKENLRSETESLLQLVTKSAFELVANDYEELVSLRKVVSETDDRIADMSKTYLKEISMTRDRHRIPSEVVQEVSSRFGFDDRKEEHSPHVEFYEPLKYLSEVARSAVLQILDEKIKAMFSYDPTLREKANEFEIARFEDTMKDERLKSLERLNSRLRDENRDFREQVNSLRKQMERANWDLAQAQRDYRRVEGEISELKSRLDVRTCDAETQYENPLKLARASLPEAFCTPLSPAESPRRHSMQSLRSESMQKVPSLRFAPKCDAAVQADLHDARSSGGDGDAHPSRSRVYRRKSSFECHLEKEGWEMEAGKAGLEIELNKLRRDFDKAKQILLQRDKVIKRLEQELKEAKAEQVHRSVSKERPSAPKEQEEVAETELIDDMKLHENLIAAQERAAQEAEKAAQAWQQVELLKQQARTLRHEREQAKAEATKAEERRIKTATACTNGTASQELSAELAIAAREKTALIEELDCLKGALSMALSRNAALEVLVTSLKSEPAKAPRFLKRRSQESLSAESRELECLHSHRTELVEKVFIQKEQLGELVKENTTLHLALEEMQQEVRSLTDQLRKVVPAIEVMDADLEACLNRMEKVVKNGGGAYVRLHKDHKLREIAKQIRTTTRAIPDSFVDEDLTNEVRQNRSDTKEPSSRPMSKEQSMSPTSPHPPAVQAVARRKQWATCDDLTAGLAAASPSPMPSARARAKPLPSLTSVARRSCTMPDMEKSMDTRPSPRLMHLEERGSLVLGSKGGMAVIGPNSMRSGRG